MRRIIPVFVVVTLLLSLGVSPARADATIVQAYTPPDLPEGLAIDKVGNTYVGFAFTGEVRKIARDGTATTIARLDPGQGFMTGIAIDAPGNVYVGLASFNPDTSGVWRIGRDGSVGRFAALPADGAANGLAFDSRGNLFVSDSFRASIWRLSPTGGVEEWLTDPLFAGSTESCGGGFLPIGINGIAFDVHGDLIGVNTTFGTLFRIPVGPDSSPGTVEVVKGECSLTGADGIALDNRRNVYVALNAPDMVVRVDPSGGVETLATHADGLDFPASLAFGTGLLGRTNTYVTSFAAGRFLGFVPGDPHPSLDVIDADVPGRPLP